MLELSGIDAGYGSFQALFGISMSVKAGEAVAVIGSNGAGKTTLLRAISGVQGTSIRRALRKVPASASSPRATLTPC